ISSESVMQLSSCFAKQVLTRDVSRIMHRIYSGRGMEHVLDCTLSSVPQSFSCINDMILRCPNNVLGLCQIILSLTWPITVTRRRGLLGRYQPCGKVYRV